MRGMYGNQQTRHGWTDLSKLPNVSENEILAGRDFKVNDHTVGVVNSQKRKRKAGVSDGQTTKCLKHTTKP